MSEAIEPPFDTVREELDAWAEYRAQRDAAFDTRRRWREAMDAVEANPDALAYWRGLHLERGN